MTFRSFALPLAITVCCLGLSGTVAVQQHVPGMQHTPGMVHTPTPAQPKEPGQSAFAAIKEVVAILEADPATDWTKVNLEALRAHLADMDMVTLRAKVAATTVPGGLAMDVTGDAAVAAAITRMVVPHAAQLDADPAWSATTRAIRGGVRLTVTAERAEDTKTVARIRGLGFAGLLVQGDHHTAHHLAMATGRGHDAHHR